MYKKLDEKTMHLILETGIDQFARFGLDRANINTIAKAAGVSVGVLYKYFGDKDSFFWPACVTPWLSWIRSCKRPWRTKRTLSPASAASSAP